MYTVGQVVLADYSCTDADSGIRHCEGNVPSGDPIDTRFIGSHDFIVFAADQAGNPISVATGNKYERQVDYVDGGLLHFTRHYNSGLKTWVHDYMMRVIATSTSAQIVP